MRQGTVQIVRPFNQADIVFLTQSSLLSVELLSGQESLLSAEKVNRMKVLDPLILDRCTERRDIEIKALASQPGRPVLIKGVRVFFTYRVKKAQFVLPFGLDDPIRSQLCPDPGAGKPPVRAVTVLFFIEGKIRIPPLKKRHDGTGQAEKELELGSKITGLQNVFNVPPHVNGL